MNDEVKQYRVNVKGMTQAPAVGPDGQFAVRVQFHVEPLTSGSPYDFDGGLVGGETLRRCELLRTVGRVVIELSADADLNREQIINLALEKVATDAA